jgi:hypothetical protein
MYFSGLASGIPVGGDFDLELRGLLHAIDDRTVLVCGLWFLASTLPCRIMLKDRLHLRQAQFLFNNVSLCCPAESLVQPRPTEFEAQLVEFLRSVPIVPHRSH